MPEAKKDNKNLIIAIVLGILPIVAIIIYVFTSGGVTTLARPDMKVLAKWREGQVKTMVKEWMEDGIRKSEFCYYDPSGKNWGCGKKHNNNAWDGTFVQWYWYDSSKKEEEEVYGVPRFIRRYKNGRANGEWVTYYDNGQPSSITVYKDAKRVAWKLYTKDGKIMSEGTAEKSKE